MQRLNTAVCAARARSFRGAAALLALTLGCSSAAPGPSYPYLHDTAFRRSELEAALVNPANAYSQLRLSHYATGSAADWDTLPEWNPATDPIGAAELDEPGGATLGSFASPGQALGLPDESSLDEATLVTLGQAAFERYPAQIAPYLAVPLSSRTAAAKYGLWVDDARGVGGVVRVRMGDGTTAIALTCSSCHAAARAGGIEAGAPNAELNLGAALVAAQSLDPQTATNIAAWGAGRLDVTTTAGTEPARIADLRPVRFQTNLHQDATWLMRDETALAIRIETLLITSSGQVLRPPRIVPLALAAYLLSLAKGLPDPSAADSASAHGAQLFRPHCASCHAPPAFSGPAVALDAIGTNPELGLSIDRGTGTYRVPSLRGVATRGPLLHDGTLPSLEAMFDPARTSAGFGGALHSVSSVPGHPFALDWSSPDRTALLDYLYAL